MMRDKDQNIPEVFRERLWTGAQRNLEKLRK